MMKSRALFPLFTIIAFLTTALAQNSGPPLPPHTVIQQASEELLEAIDGRREMFDANPDQLHAVVDDVLRSRFDTVYAARLILPRHWAGLDGSQREKFVDALYRSLVRRYSVGVLEHNETRVRVTPLRLELKDAGEEVFETVRTIVTLDDGTEVPVNYEMRFFDHVWKAYDVNIEGRSYVAYYRDFFRQEIDSKGFDQVVDELNTT